MFFIFEAFGLCVSGDGGGVGIDGVKLISDYLVTKLELQLIISRSTCANKLTSWGAYHGTKTHKLS